MAQTLPSLTQGSPRLNTYSGLPNMVSRLSSGLYTVISAIAPMPRWPRSRRPRLRAGAARVMIAISYNEYSRSIEDRTLAPAASLFIAPSMSLRKLLSMSSLIRCG